VLSKEGAGVFYPQDFSRRAFQRVGMRLFSLTPKHRGDTIRPIWRVGLRPVCTCRLFTWEGCVPGSLQTTHPAQCRFLPISQGPQMCLCEELCTGKRLVYTHCRRTTGAGSGESRRASDASSVISPITACNCFIRLLSDPADRRMRASILCVAPPGRCVCYA